MKPFSITAALRTIRKNTYREEKIYVDKKIMDR